VLIRLRYAVLGVVIAAAGAGVPAALVTGAVKAGYIRVSHLGAGSARAAGVRAGTRATPFGAFGLSSPRRLIVPDLVAVLPAGLSAAQVGEIGGLAGVRAVLAVAGVAVLINAPGADLAALMRQVQGILGAGGTVRNLVPVAAGVSLPVDGDVPSGRPASWLDLYRESAARYCPGLSWTVLAAIGQIESGDGADEGPSSAGALGPMQFMPSTWRIWGTDGFGQTGTPDVMNPLDAVPSAARMLCAAGAASGGLSAAIFGYNHAGWYVSEVLALAGEYAREYA
jgi:hypothetical protein